MFFPIISCSSLRLSVIALIIMTFTVEWALKTNDLSTCDFVPLLAEWVTDIVITTSGR